MSNYWISDSENRVLGPVGLEVLSDLMTAGRITQVTRVSRDGHVWWPLAEVPELARLYAEKDPSFRRARDRAEAQKLRAQLEGLRVRPAHEIFRVPKDAPIEQWREAFFALSKKFHPDVVPAGADEELKQACALAFRFLSGLMNRAEADHAARQQQAQMAQLANDAVKERAARGARGQQEPAPKAPEPPRYNPEDYVGIKTLGPGAAQARIRVTDQNAGMFTDHPLMNFGKNSFFLADDRVLPLGTVVALTFTFDEPAYTIIGRGKVAWEDAGFGQSPHGFGITFLELAKNDREFLRSFVERVKRPQRRAGGR